MKRISLLILLLVAAGVQLMADVVRRGEIQREFKVINLNEFPSYKFYILYTGYRYDKGYRPNEPFKLWLEQDSVYSTSGRYDTSLLYAVSKKDSSIEYTSGRALGGRDFVSSDNISSIIDVVRITQLAKGKLYFSIVKEIVVYDDETTKERRPTPRANFLPFPGGDGGTPGWLYWLLPSVSVLILGLFWFWRRRQKRDYTLQPATA